MAVRSRRPRERDGVGNRGNACAVSLRQILHGIETTNEGGNTLFANLHAAWEGLDEETRERVRALRVVHDHDRILEDAEVRENHQRYRSRRLRAQPGG